MSDEVPVEIFKNPAAERICQWLRIDNPSVEGIEHLSDSDWDATLLNAIRLGLAPICYVQLKALKKLDYLPLDVLNGLKEPIFCLQRASVTAPAYVKINSVQFHEC